MADSQATVQDLSDRSLRTLTTLELAWGDTKLQDAFDQIVTLRPSVSTRLDLDPVGPLSRVVTQVQCAMVLRVLNNPNGTLEETGDDYTRRLDASVSTGALYVTEAEMALVSAQDNASDGAWSIRPRIDPVLYYPDPWNPTGQIYPV